MKKLSSYLTSIDEMKSMIKQFKPRLIDKLIDLAEWLNGWPIACVYSRLEKYKSDKTWCPFCVSPWLWKQWEILFNEFPYPRTESHLLLVPKRHITKYSELQWCELDELADILGEYLWGWYLMLWRQYPMAGSSVEHLHIHLIKS